MRKSKAIAILTILTISLLSGCLENENENSSVDNNISQDKTASENITHKIENSVSQKINQNKTNIVKQKTGYKKDISYFDSLIGKEIKYLHPSCGWQDNECETTLVIENKKIKNKENMVLTENLTITENLTMPYWVNSPVPIVDDISDYLKNYSDAPWEHHIGVKMPPSYKMYVSKGGYIDKIEITMLKEHIWCMRPSPPPTPCLNDVGVYHPETVIYNDFLKDPIYQILSIYYGIEPYGHRFLSYNPMFNEIENISKHYELVVLYNTSDCPDKEPTLILFDLMSDTEIVFPEYFSEENYSCDYFFEAQNFSSFSHEIQNQIEEGRVPPNVIERNKLMLEHANSFYKMLRDDYLTRHEYFNKQSVDGEPANYIGNLYIKKVLVIDVNSVGMEMENVSGRECFKVDINTISYYGGLTHPFILNKTTTLWIDKETRILAKDTEITNYGQEVEHELIKEIVNISDKRDDNLKEYEELMELVDKVGYCEDNFCNPENNETIESCCKDCGCPKGKICNGVCMEDKGNNLEFSSEEYGFGITLPPGWRGKWRGNSIFFELASEPWTSVEVFFDPSLENRPQYPYSTSDNITAGNNNFTIIYSAPTQKDYEDNIELYEDVRDSFRGS
jgi:hypothetical protein